VHIDYRMKLHTDRSEKLITFSGDAMQQVRDRRHSPEDDNAHTFVGVMLGEALVRQQYRAFVLLYMLHSRML
jgi:hypothetical protein